MDCMGSYVIHLQGRVPCQLALDRKVPGLDVRIDGIIRLDDREERQCRLGEGPQRGVTGEQLVAELGKSGNRTGGEIVADAVGIYVRRVVDFAPFRRVEED